MEQSRKKLLGQAEQQLLGQHKKELLEKENSGCAWMLANSRNDDLKRMFRLLSRISDGLAPMSDIFREHIQAEGTARLRQVADEITAKAAEGARSKASKDASSMLELESEARRAPETTGGNMRAYRVRVRKSTRQCSGHAG